MGCDKSRGYENDIAIIGMNLRFPGISTEEEFWDVLKNGKDNLFLEKAIKKKTKSCIPVHSNLEKTEYFDREFFGYTKREAELMDPQHRVFLQCAWELLEKAGYNPLTYQGLIGLFAGVSTSTYLMNNLMTNNDTIRSAGDLQLSILNEKDHFVGKMAYKLNLKGPCVTVQTVCSTSLVATHLACQSLLNGECDLAMAGGVTIRYPQENSYNYYQNGILSDDGHVRAFDQGATGTVYSDGLGILLLKRMEDALEEGDTIRAVIRGSAINTDGNERVGYTAPGVNGQLAAIVEAQTVSDVPVETIGMIEAHGSGTPLGDEIELDALIQAFEANTEKKAFCALGSVKTNIGHTQNASGVAGIIKAVLALEHKQIPPSINCKNPSKRLGFEETPFYINTFLSDWMEYGHPRRAGVSSFGLGGVNGHIILEEAPKQLIEHQDITEKYKETYCLSARTNNALARMIENHIDYIRKHDINLKDAAITLKTGRIGFKYRIVVNFEDKESLLEGLETAKQQLKIQERRSGNKLSYMRGEKSAICFEDIIKEAGKNKLLQEVLNKFLKENDLQSDVVINWNQNEKEQFAQEVLARYLKNQFPEIEESQYGIIQIGYSKEVDTRHICLENLLSQIWENGCEVDWNTFYQNVQYRHITLPTYPFEMTKYFIEPCHIINKDNDKKELLEITLGGVKEKLRNIWMEKLGLETIDDDDNFFQLGGHSLLATQVIFEVNSICKIDFPLQRFYETSSLKEFSEAVYDSLLHNQDYYDDLPIVEEKIGERYEPFPLTDVQKAYWIGRNDAMELGNTSTHMYFESDMETLDIERFEKAFCKMIERHEMLRAVILPNGMQKILKNVPDYRIRIEDISQEPSTLQNQKINEIREEMSHQIFDCYTWPLFDIRATKMSSEKIKLHISIDLLIADAWSLELLLEELSYVYHNPDVVQEPLRLSFRDYVNTVNQIEITNRYYKSKIYWNERVKNLPQAPILPLQVDPSTVRSPHFVRRREVIKSEEWRKIKERATKYRISETVVLITAFSEILALWSRERRFTLNLTLFNRLPVHEQVNDIMGDFTTLTLLEIENDASCTLIDRMRRNQQQLLKDMDYRYYNGIRVTRDLMGKYKDYTKAIMPIIFTSILNQKSSSWGENEHFINSVEEEKTTYGISQTPQVWLDHQVIERNGNLIYNWDVVEEIFPEKMIDEMFQDYRMLIGYLSESDEVWKSMNPLCEERFKFPHLQKLAQSIHKEERNNSDFEIPNFLLHDCFIEQANQIPEALAVITSEQKITYAELNRMSNRIAELIQKRKEPKNKLIAVVMEKGWEQIVSVLGILKSGHAYLPVDSTQPKQRILEILELAEVSTYLVQNYSEVLGEIGNQIIVDEGLLKECREYPNCYISYFPVICVEPDDTAYVIFTSGSTGKPKGVIISHRGAMNTIMDVNSRFQVNSRDRVLALSSLCFDLSVYDIFGMLSRGAALVLPDSDKLRDPEHWEQLIKQNQVTIWNTVPALMKMFVGIGTSEAFNNLRLVLMSGDWIDTTLPDIIWRRNKNAKIISLGGATEASIWSVIYPIQKNITYCNSIPYGKAMHHQTMYILNSAMQQCPIGVPGEIFIGGVGVAKGYWKEEEKTKRQFITSPFTNEYLYRTGDLGCYLQDGNIEFLGRQDNQIKINGYRIELGEIECIIRGNKLVKDVAVIVDDKTSVRKMIAFVQVDKKNMYGLQETEDENIILDSAERMQFKLKELAIRKLQKNERIHLDNSLLDEKEFYRHRSYRCFSKEVIPLSSFTRLLGVLAQKKDENMLFPKYRYASSGGVYPVQTYLYIKEGRIENISEGIYYYDPKNHDLVLLSKNIDLLKDMHERSNQDIFQKSAFSIFLVGKLNVIKKMYGEKHGIDFMKVEAGLITSLLENTGVENHIGFCQIGTLDFRKIKKVLEVDEDDYYLHCLLGGYITEEQMSYEGFLAEMDSYWKKGDERRVNVIKILKQELKEKLPNYMIPSQIVLINTLPLTVNGKIDRNALLDMAVEAAPKVLRIPETDVQEKVYDIWKEYLGGKDFGIQDNFFDLGGDSVMTVQIYERVKKEFTRPMSIADMFSYPTVESLARFLSEGENTCGSWEEEERKRVNKRKLALSKRGKGV